MEAVGDSVLVVVELSPDRYDAIVAASAVICADGGRTGHMESLCRSRGIPVLRVDRAELDGIVGKVTVRLDRQSVTLGEAKSPRQAPTSVTAHPGDLGSICVVIAAAADVEATNALTPRIEQVTSFFVREEFVCLAAGLSPLDALRAGPRAAERYGAAIGSEVCAIAKELLPGQRLVLRLLDLRSDDAARITTAEVGQETNPDLGLHGARWLLKDQHYPSAFRALRAYVRERLGPDAERVGFAVPFINDHHEFRRLRQHLDLPDDVPLAVFVETPAAVHSAADFCAAGAAELFVGTKDLVQFYLAADRANHLVATSYQTRHPAVLAGIGQVVTAARRAATPVHVFALAADLDHFARNLPATGFMMCTAEVRLLAPR
ncbi:MAG TPA: putative PEP-binding protein [Actinokineospora sp.]|jgi:phosphoenolpyruvate-protein kinase (PTS system EI component)|nr:putative PEP-binding protein [Actinokineospora sp.]